MSGHAIRWIPYTAADMLDGCQELEPDEELAYRRICDLIYKTGDCLPDRDTQLTWQTRSRNRPHWRRVKARLLALDKIFIENGLIRNRRCIEELAKSETFFAQKSEAGRRSAESRERKRKLLETNKTVSTDVQTDVSTDVSTGGVTSLQSTKSTKKERETTKKRANGADAPPAANAKRYAFEGEVIKVNQKDYDRWKGLFKRIGDLDAELYARDLWLADQPEAIRKKWFVSTATFLKNKNDEQSQEWRKYLAEHPDAKPWSEMTAKERKDQEFNEHMGVIERMPRI